MIDVGLKASAMVFAMRTEFLGASLKASTPMKAAPAPKAPAVQAFFKKAEKQLKSAAPKATQVRSGAIERCIGVNLPRIGSSLPYRTFPARFNPDHIPSLPASPFPRPQVVKKAEKDVKRAATPAPMFPSKLPSFGTVKKEAKKAAPPQVNKAIADPIRSRCCTLRWRWTGPPETRSGFSL